MHLILYGTNNDLHEITVFMQELIDIDYNECTYSLFEDYEHFMQSLTCINYDIVIVMQEGAAGMEGVFAARKLCPATPTIWFSDDKNFAPQSYRLSCSYFAPKPINKTTLKRALMRCALP